MVYDMVLKNKTAKQALFPGDQNGGCQPPGPGCTGDLQCPPYPPYPRHLTPQRHPLLCRLCLAQPWAVQKLIGLEAPPLLPLPSRLVAASRWDVTATPSVVSSGAPQASAPVPAWPSVALGSGKADRAQNLQSEEPKLHPRKKDRKIFQPSPSPAALSAWPSVREASAAHDRRRIPAKTNGVGPGVVDVGFSPWVRGPGRPSATSLAQ